MALWPWRRSRAQADAQALLDAAIRMARQPGLFGPSRAADTLEGRLEMLNLHAALALYRLQRDADAAPLAQEFADKLFRHLDSGLREAGIGDTAVPKRMRKLAGEFYGRLRVYSDALSTGDAAALEAALQRNALGPQSAGFAPLLASYALQTAAKQQDAPVAALLRLDGWLPAPG